MQGAPYEPANYSTYETMFPNSNIFPKGFSDNPTDKEKDTTEPLDITTKSVKEISENYRLLQKRQKKLRKEMDAMEGPIKTLKEASDTVNKSLDELIQMIYISDVHTKEDIEKYMNVKREFFTVHDELVTKTLFTLQKQHSTKEDELDKVNLELGQYTEFLKDSANTILGDAANPYHCPICFEKPPNVVFVPCGHAFCSDCNGRNTQNTLCMVCRTHAEKKIRLYL